MEIKKKQEIKTERLLLRPYEEKDRDQLTDILMNEEIAKTFMIPSYSSREQYLELADKLIEFSSVEDKKHLEYGIFLDDVLVGFINDCGFDDEKIEVGYVVHPRYQNHGYASEALKAVIDELWEMGFETVFASYFEGNTASRKVMEKCGMTGTGEVCEEEYRGKKYRSYTCEIHRQTGPDSR